MGKDEVYPKKENVIFSASMLLSMLILFIFINTSVQADTQLGEVLIGNAAPSLNVTIENEAATFTLTENTTTLLNCNATIVDNNGDSDIVRVNATLYFLNGTYDDSSPDDNNFHYTNDTCTLDTGFGTGEEARGICYFSVEYYAYNGTWNCNVTVEDTAGVNVSANDTIVFDPLVALNVPSTMHFGTVDALDVSQENITNVTNTGNVNINVGFDGYARTDGDNLSMNCTSGSTQNISIGFLKYNLTTGLAGAAGSINLSEFEANYTNLTDEQVTETNFTIRRRENDTNLTVGAINQTYWRIFIPLGVAGTCTGNIVYTAVVANPSA